METIKLSVCGKTASVPGGTKIVLDNTDYQVELLPDSQWESQSAVTVRLVTDTGVSQSKVVGAAGTVTLDRITSGSKAFIGVYAGNLQTTEFAVIPLYPSIRTLAGVDTPPTQAVYDQIMAILNGFSATVTKSGNTATITIVDPEGTTTATVTDGETGAAGKSAYAAAQDGGYTGTESQFNTDLASVSGKISTSVIQTSVSAASTDSQVPSAKLLYDTVGNVEAALNAIRGVS